MAQWHDRVDGFLGRLVFRAAGLGCAVIALVCAYAAWWHVENPIPRYSWVPVLLFSLAALGAGSVVPYCLSRDRRFVEALDAMEGGVGDQPPRR